MRNLHNLFHSGWTMLHFYKQSMMIQISPKPYQHSFFFYDSHCNRYEVIAYDLHFSGDYVCWASFINLLTIRVSWRNIYSSLACYAKSLQSCPTFWDPMDCSPPGSSIHGILQARILESVAMPSFRGSSQSRVRNHVSYVSCIGKRVLYH